MEILKDLSDVISINGPLGITIGNFDGVHLGHQDLIANIKDHCHRDKLKLLVITFVPHPKLILDPSGHFIINSYSDRRKLMEFYGVDFLFEINFSRDFSTKTPLEFLNQMIKPIKNLQHLFLGHDFAFGANKEGSANLVNKCFPQTKVTICEQFFKGGHAVSSSLIRNSIERGDLETANQLLGREFFVSGRVIKGDGRGRQIGFPTANIFTQHEHLIPMRGVYITKTMCHGQIYNSITNVGYNPTFNKNMRMNIETNLFEFSDDIYGEEITIHFYKKIRDEKKFSSVEDLKAQITRDVNEASDFIKNV